MDIYQNNEHILKKSRFSNKSGRLPHKAVELTCMILLRVSWHQYSLLWHTVKNECKWIGNLTPQIFNNLNGIVSRKLQTKHMGLQSKGNNSASQQQVHIARFYVNFVESKHSHLITSQCLQTTENDPPPPPKKCFWWENGNLSEKLQRSNPIDDWIKLWYLLSFPGWSWVRVTRCRWANRRNAFIGRLGFFPSSSLSCLFLVGDPDPEWGLEVESESRFC